MVPLRLVSAAVLLALITACSPAPTREAHDLVVSNQTALAITLAVNGVVVRTVRAHSDEAVIAKDLPPQPWLVEARSPAGRVLSSMTVRAGDVWETGTQMKGDAVRVDLSCGRLDMWSGPPMLGPLPGPGRPGDCD
jgi:uncharacterized NAD(P)/FAD-binding protein YdhS